MKQAGYWCGRYILIIGTKVYLDACGIVWAITRVFIVIKMLTELQVNDFKVIFLLIFALLSDYISGGSAITTAIWFICGAKNINVDRLLKPIFYTHLIGVSFVVFLALSGTIENTVYNRGTGEIRYSMGFYHPNTFAGHMILLVSIYLMLRNLYKKIRFIDCAIITVCTVWTYIITNSGTGVILMGTLCILGLVICFSKLKLGFIKRINEFLLDKLKYVMIAMPIFVLWLTLVFDSGLIQFQGTLLSRVSQAAIYFKYYTPNLLGHLYDFHSVLSAKAIH